MRVTDFGTRSIVVDLCATPDPSLRRLVENFRTGLSRSVSEALRASSIGSKIHTNAAIDGITPRISKRGATDDSAGSTQGEDVLDVSADTDAIEM